MVRVPMGPVAPIGRPVAAIVLVSITIAWMLLTLLDLRDDDGMASMMAMFGIPALASSVIIQIVFAQLAERRRIPKSAAWWTLVVLPLGVLGGHVVAVLRDPDYFIGDDGPWMLLWMPVFTWLAILLGSLVWFFFVLPVASLATAIGRIVRGEASAGTVVLPLVLLSLGILCLVGGLSITTDASGRASWGAIIAAFLGIPGAYDVVWEPGLWIVRGIVAAIVLVFAGPALWQRLRGEARDDRIQV